MKNINIDLFKISLVVILLGFLFLFYQYSQNGRFHIDGSYIFDTRTGTLWINDDNHTELIGKPVQE